MMLWRLSCIGVMTTAIPRCAEFRHLEDSACPPSRVQGTHLMPLSIYLGISYSLQSAQAKPMATDMELTNLKARRCHHFL